MIGNSLFLAITLTATLGLSTSFGGSFDITPKGHGAQTVFFNDQGSGHSTLSLNRPAPGGRRLEAGVGLIPQTKTEPSTQRTTGISFPGDNDDDGIDDDGIDFNGPALNGARIDIRAHPESHHHGG